MIICFEIMVEMLLVELSWDRDWFWHLHHKLYVFYQKKYLYFILFISRLHLIWILIYKMNNFDSLIHQRSCIFKIYKFKDILHHHNSYIIYSLVSNWNISNHEITFPCPSQVATSLDTLAGVLSGHIWRVTNKNICQV